MTITFTHVHGSVNSFDNVTRLTQVGQHTFEIITLREGVPCKTRVTDVETLEVRP